MAVVEGKVAVTEGAGKNLATTTVTTAAGTVEREEVVLADPETVAARAKITNTDPGETDYGVVTRLAGSAELGRDEREQGALMLAALYDIREVLSTMSEALQEIAGNDMRQSLAKKGGRHVSLVRNGKQKWLE